MAKINESLRFETYVDKNGIREIKPARHVVDVHELAEKVDHLAKLFDAIIPKLRDDVERLKMGEGVD